MKAAVAAFAAVAFVSGSGCLVQAWRASAGPRHLVAAAGGRALSVPAQGRTLTMPPPATTTTVPAPAGTAPPATLQVPAVGLQAPIVPVGLTADGQMNVPAPSVAGWYRLGPSPGAVGPAVLVGHVDSSTGPAVFYRLTGVRVGDEVIVVNGDGSRSRFVISRLTVVNKGLFPSAAVFAPTAQPEIRLITCTGPFDTHSHHYVDSLILWGVATT